jgi:hypothetical protein
MTVAKRSALDLDEIFCHTTVMYVVCSSHIAADATFASSRLRAVLWLTRAAVLQ